MLKCTYRTPPARAAAGAALSVCGASDPVSDPVSDLVSDPVDAVT
jgi:hypothetical protein